MCGKLTDTNDNRAVSPVIGVVLMVGIVVALGAVVGGAVLGLGVGIGETAPNAQFDVSYDGTYITVEHNAGETIDSDQLNYLINGNDGILTATQSFPDSVRAGDSARFASVVGETIDTGDTFTLQWESESGETTATLVEYELDDS